MEPTLDSFAERLAQPWLADAEQAKQFSEAFGQSLAAMNAPAADTVVVICESDRVACLAQVFSALALKRCAFLGNPSWGEYEWGQANAIIAGQRGDQRSGGLMIPTGGTGGKIKFAEHTWATLTAAVEGYARYWKRTTLNAVCPLPVCHIGGLMLALRTFISGGQLWLTDPKLEQAPPPGFDLSAAHVSLVGAQLRRALDNDLSWLHDCEAVLVGGGPTDAELINEALTAGIPLYLAYGLTEAAATVALAKIRPGGGVPLADVLPHWKVGIEAGEIMLAGEALFRGYAGEADRGGEFWATNDRGELVDGKLRVIGRMGRFIVTGGRKVDADYLEARLRDWPELSDVFVFGRAHPKWGEAVVAIVVTDSATEALQQLAQARLMPEMRPKTWQCVDEIPRLENGKPNWARIHFLMNKK